MYQVPSLRYSGSDTIPIFISTQLCWRSFREQEVPFGGGIAKNRWYFCPFIEMVVLWVSAFTLKAVSISEIASPKSVGWRDCFMVLSSIWGVCCQRRWDCFWVGGYWLRPLLSHYYATKVATHVSNYITLLCRMQLFFRSEGLRVVMFWGAPVWLGERLYRVWGKQRMKCWDRATVMRVLLWKTASIV